MILTLCKQFFFSILPAFFLICQVDPAYSRTYSFRDQGEANQANEPPNKDCDPFRSDKPQLIPLLTKAARCNKPKPSIDFLTQAKQLISQGVDVKARDANGRTALHWAVIALLSKDAAKTSQQNVYMEAIEMLINNQADVNAEDSYGHTPLDWNEYVRSDDLEQLLLDNGAQRGRSHDESLRMKSFSERVYRLVDTAGSVAEIKKELPRDLLPGTEIYARLTTEVSSKESRPGDPVEAVIYAPVLSRDGAEIVVTPGTKLFGTVMTAKPAKSQYDRALLVISFTRLEHSDGSKALLDTRLVAVDNARETVTQGQIIGIEYPRKGFDRLSWATKVVGFADPGLSLALQAATFAAAKGYQRDIVYRNATDLVLGVATPYDVPGGRREHVRSEAKPPRQLIDLINGQPLSNENASKEPIDIINLMFVGSGEKLVKAFETAGWAEAKKLNAETEFKSFVATAYQKGYAEAPFSQLFLKGRPADYEIQKQTNTFAKRHHLRIYNTGQKYEGQDVWLATATHDIGIEVRIHGGSKWTHRVDPRIDQERTKIKNDLVFTGLVEETAFVDRPSFSEERKNTTRALFQTDGRVLVIFLK